MWKVTKIDRVALATPDLERQSDYYERILGLARVDGSSKARLFSCGAAEPAVALQAGPTPQCTSIAFRVNAEAELKAIASTLKEKGLSVALASDPGPGERERLTIAGPEGISIALAHEPSPGPAKTAPAQTTGLSPLKLGHVAFNVHDVKGAADFFVEALGFRVSDWMGDFFVFLRCGPDHHTVNFVHGERAKMHHVAFEGRDWQHIKEVCDFLGSQGIPLIWGPGRHGVGHNIFIYHHNPDGQIIELYIELDQMSDEALGAFDPRPWHEDNPQRPKVWKPGPKTSNIWGIPTPQAFRD
jgi:catechol 2,3-dioxygenase-like lactoylglutathione lyase family enzyme